MISLPRFSGFHDGVDDGQQLAHARHERNLGQLSRTAQAFIAHAQRRIVTHRAYPGSELGAVEKKKEDDEKQAISRRETTFHVVLSPERAKDNSRGQSAQHVAPGSL